MKRFVTAAALLAFAGVAAAQQAPAAATAAPKVVAVVNGESITVDQIDRLYAKLSDKARASYEANGGKQQFLEQYINKRLVVQEAVKENFAKRADIVPFLDDARESALFDLYVRNVISTSVVTDADLKAYYDAHQDAFTAPPKVRARHIIVTPMNQAVSNKTNDNAKTEPEAKAKIERLAKQNLTPENFASMAAMFSEDGSALNGGDLGWFAPGKMVKEFDDVAFKLKKGEISPIVKTSFGYHLIFVEDRREGGVRPFPAVRNEVREKLLIDHADKLLVEVNKLTQELRKMSNVQMHPENLEN